MLFKNKDLLITSVQLLKGKKDGSPYLLVKVIDVDDGCEYSFIEKENLDLMSKIKPMEKWKTHVLIVGDKYGTHFKIKEFIEKVGQV